MRATTNFLGLLLAFASGVGLGQESVEVIALRHRTADQVIPVLRPLLAPGGASTGTAGSSGGMLSSRESARSSDRSMWLKVEEIR